MEIWKDIPEYEGIYQASSLGRIRTVEGKTTFSKRHGVRHWKSRIMSGRGDNKKTGKRVCLWKDGKAKDFLVARLVALAFLGEPPEGFTVNHIDGNRMNNDISNLEWLSLGDNIRHAFENELTSGQITVKISKLNGGETIRFRSMAELDRYLKRGRGYTSAKAKRGCKSITDVNGFCYRLSVEREV